MYKNDGTFSRLNKKQVMKYELIVEFFAIFFLITRESRAHWWGNESDRKSRILTQKYIWSLSWSIDQGWRERGRCFIVINYQLSLISMQR